MGDEYSHPFSGASCRSPRFIWLSSRRRKEIGIVTGCILIAAAALMLVVFLCRGAAEEPPPPPVEDSLQQIQIWNQSTSREGSFKRAALAVQRSETTVSHIERKLKLGIAEKQLSPKPVTRLESSIRVCSCANFPAMLSLRKCKDLTFKTSQLKPWEKTSLKEKNNQSLRNNAKRKGEDKRQFAYRQKVVPKQSCTSTRRSFWSTERINDNTYWSSKEQEDLTERSIPSTSDALISLHNSRIRWKSSYITLSTKRFMTHLWFLDFLSSAWKVHSIRKKKTLWLS